MYLLRTRSIGGSRMACVCVDVLLDNNGALLAKRTKISRV